MKRKELIAQARAEGKLIYSVVQDAWFTPDELETQNPRKRLDWDAVGFRLRDPQEKLGSRKALCGEK